MLHLRYPDLDNAAPARIWQTMFDAAGLTLVDGTFTDLAPTNINGRQIRNLVRLARILHPDRKVNPTQVHEILGYSCK